MFGYKEYHLICEECPEELGKEVASYLADGWKLHGSPFVFTDIFKDGTQKQQLAQAVVHREVKF